MNIKNYTTEVPASRSIENIEKLLMQFGATNIMKEVKDGRVASISFLIMIDLTSFAFKLPANVETCYKWLKDKSPRTRDETVRAQAERIAWKHQYEWLYIQLTSVTLAQIDKMQALLPYSYNPQTGRSFYDHIKENKFHGLLSNG